MHRIAALTLLSLLLLAAPLAAQTLPLPTGGDTAEADAAAAPADTQALIDLLRNDTAREALIKQLEAGASAEGQEDGTATAPADEEEPSLGHRISTNASFFTDRVVASVVRTYNQVLRVPARLDDAIKAADPGFLGQLLRELALMILVTYGAYFLVRRVSRALSRRLAAAANHRPFLSRLGLALVSAALDVLVVGIAVTLALLVASFLSRTGEGAQLSFAQNAYLTAFAAVELCKVLGRFILSPRLERFRFLPLQTDAAWQIWAWLATSIVILGYGQLLLVPVASDEIGHLAGYALTSIIGAVVLLFTLLQVVLHRHTVAAWIAGSEEDGPGWWAGLLAASWHYLAILYLLGLLVVVLIRPGNVLLPLLLGSVKIIAILLAGLFLRNWASRLARRGVNLRPGTREMFPMLERRINAILPRMLTVLRVVILVVIVIATGHVLGLLNFFETLGAGGATLTGGVITIIGILIGALLAWLAIASWVDYRLNPAGNRVPTSRETTLLTLLYNASTIAIVIFALMFILSEVGINIGPLIASAGVLGLAIGFGAQKLVQDIITGIFIQFENAINVGDVITVGGITGTAEKLTVRSVSLRDVEGVFHIIPFSSVDMVSNYMRDFSFYVCDMGIAYREDIEEARAAMHDAFTELTTDEEHAPFILGELEWFGLNSFGDSAIVLRARIKTTPGKQWGIGRAYNLILKRIFDERGIEIPFPHQTIYFGVDRDGKAPPLHIARDDAEG